MPIQPASPATAPAAAARHAAAAPASPAGPAPALAGDRLVLGTAAPGRPAAPPREPGLLGWLRAQAPATLAMTGLGLAIATVGAALAFPPLALPLGLGALGALAMGGAVAIRNAFWSGRLG